MSYSNDDQSEDGELRQSPSRRQPEPLDFSLSDEEADPVGLEIKPPQALAGARRRHAPRAHRRPPERHREKRREGRCRERRRPPAAADEKRHRAEERKGGRERHRRYEEEKRERGDRTLQDLRERLLSKRTGKGDEEAYHSERTFHKKYHETLQTADLHLEGESTLYVKEILNITADSDRSRPKHAELVLTEDERFQQELRKEKLLEAEREMARVKEQSRLERERRHLEKAAKRRQQLEEDFYNKRFKNEELSTITVSDNSESDDENVKTSSNESLSSESDERSPSPSSEAPSRSPSPKTEKEPVEPTEEKPIEEKVVKLDDNLPAYYPAVQGCRSVEEFQCLNRIEEGTYGVVYRAKDKRTEDIVALKRLKMEKEKEGFPITSLREINTLLKGQHPNIVTVREIVVGSNMDKIFIVMDYVEHDLKSLMETMRHKKQNFMPSEVKCLLKQLLLAVAHLHDNWILHRDLKTSNLLLSHKGILKVGDFGLAREYGSPLKAYTQIVVTLWYRAPELLLGAKEYSTPIDIWSVGCIFAELLLMNALFPGKSEVDQLNRIFRDLGTPSERIWPGYNQLPAVQKLKFAEFPVSNLRGKFHVLTDLGLNLLTKFLTFDPNQRVTAEEAIQHAYFAEMPLPIDPAMFPTWPAKSELGQKRALAASPKPPSGGGEYKKLGGDGDDDAYGFRIGMGVDHRRMGAGFNLKF